MNISQETFGCLSHLKILPEHSRRIRFDEEADFYDGNLDPFVVDENYLMNSKAFRRLAFKTQVMTSPWNGLFRNRNSHTMEVVSVAVRIASVLGLNVDLVRAIALGHDIGHVPFGHEGENFLATRFKKDFNHAKFGAMLAQKVERKGVGLNLTYQTLCGIRDHSRGKGPLTATKDMSQEAVVVMHADKIAYITSDYNDMIHRLRLPSQWVESVSSDMQKLGSDQRSRVRNLIIALCEDSAGLGFVGFSDSEAGKIFTDIKAKMYKLYPLVNVHGHTSGLMRVGDYLEDVLREKAPLFFALMTDEDVLSLMDKNHFDITDLERTSVWEQIESVLNVFADITDPCLDW